MSEKNKNKQHTDTKSGEVNAQSDAGFESEETRAGTDSPVDESLDTNSGESEKPFLDATGEEDQEQNDQDYEETITRLHEELEVAHDKMLRKAAEFDNLKKRTQRERVLLYENAKVDAVSKFLPIREDLKRSVEISRKHKVDAGFLEGLELVLSNFDRVLEQYGVEPIEETDVPFDVDKHDAMLSQPSADESKESNTVIEVMEPGYKIGDRVIRHAKVIVSQ